MPGRTEVSEKQNKESEVKRILGVNREKRGMEGEVTTDMTLIRSPG